MSIREAREPLMMATDLDGTLLNDERVVSARDRETLRALGIDGVVRVIATGRSLYSARRVIPVDLPVDYLVFSSGAGAVTWPDQAPLFGHSMSAQTTAHVHDLLLELRCDFMAQSIVPDSHRFVYVRASGADNPDFDERIRLYRDHARAGSGGEPGELSQFVVVHPGSRGQNLFDSLRAALPQCNVVRTTSPLDNRSMWIEVFPAGVSKASGCAFIADRHGVARSSIMAIGNDFNDLDMLDWVGTPYLVANGPAEMRGKYAVVASHRDSGMSESVQRWRAMW